jgi:hypothetical protein
MQQEVIIVVASPLLNKENTQDIHERQDTHSKRGVCPLGLKWIDASTPWSMISAVCAMFDIERDMSCCPSVKAGEGAEFMQIGSTCLRRSKTPEAPCADETSLSLSLGGGERILGIGLLGAKPKSKGGGAGSEWMRSSLFLFHECMKYGAYVCNHE